MRTSQGFIENSVLFGPLVTPGFSIAAESSFSARLPEATAPLAISASKSSQAEAVMTVTAPEPEKKAGSTAPLPLPTCSERAPLTSAP